MKQFRIFMEALNEIDPYQLRPKRSGKGFYFFDQYDERISVPSRQFYFHGTTHLSKTARGLTPTRGENRPDEDRGYHDEPAVYVTTSIEVAAAFSDYLGTTGSSKECAIIVLDGPYIERHITLFWDDEFEDYDSFYTPQLIPAGAFKRIIYTPDEFEKFRRTLPRNQRNPGFWPAGIKKMLGNVQ